MDVDTNEPRERWNFDIETDKEVAVRFAINSKSWKK
jgi:hypothetical protein